MIYELRIYTTIPGRMPNLLARFNDHTLKIWEKHGIKQVGFWYGLTGTSQLCHICRHISLMLTTVTMQDDPRWPRCQ